MLCASFSDSEIKLSLTIGEFNSNVPAFRALKCNLLVADGAELRFVRDNFRQLLDCPSRTVIVYTGDIADFIFKNLA